MSDSDSSSDGSPSPPRRKSSTRPKKDPQTPQQKIDEFWTKYKTKAPGKATHIIPQNELIKRAAVRASAKCKAPAKTTEQSYEASAEQCRRKVAQIVKECRRVNQKYRDPHFDLEIDLKLHRRDCLDSLDNLECNQRAIWGRGRGGHRAPRRRDRPFKDREQETGDDDGGGENAVAGGGGSVLGLLAKVEKKMALRPDGDGQRVFRPQAVARVVDIFDKPQFFIDGPTANDVRQGRDGDCWLMAALCTLSNKPGLIERLCVAHDVEVGVYGFVFHRDGEWFSEIIDDKLYLTKPDYDESRVERILWNDRERGISSEEEYKRVYQRNSGALYFAQCEDPNETWLPLLEKAYAKAHGDYSAIEGGFGGEGIEDLTGGVTSEIYTTDILDKEHFWKEELMKVNRDFLFGCSTGVFGLGWGERKGIVELHAYSILKAREIDGVRLVLLKNPWGKHEWTGAWSDGSKEWTGEWLQKLDHRFGDDGSFWISYEDLLQKYQAFDRTRLFGTDWKVAAIWTTLEVPWTLEYHDTKFAFSLSHSGPVVIVFAQLDERYFKGLEGQYRFELSFRVHKAGNAAEDYVVRSHNYYRMNRSVNVELDLDAGEYVVVVRIDAQRNQQLMPVEAVVRANAKDRREKLLRIGRAYDVAHSKGVIVETAAEKTAREAFQKRKRERERRQIAKILREDKVAAKKAEWRAKMRHKKARQKAEARAKAKAERKAARKEAKKKGKKQFEEEKEESKDKEDDGSENRENNVKEGSTTSASTETGAGMLTPTSSTVCNRSPNDDNDNEGDEEEEENYVTAAEDDEVPPEDTKKKQHVDVGVQTGPGLPLRPLPPMPPPPWPPFHGHGIGIMPPPPPPPAGAPARFTMHRGGAPSRLERGPRFSSSGSSGADSSDDDDDEDDSSSYDEDDVSEISEREIDECIDASRMQAMRAAAAQAQRQQAAANKPGTNNPSAARSGAPEAEETVDEFEEDPWNAVGVFGLRVYYRVPADAADERVRLWVERPDPFVWDESSSSSSSEEEEEKKKGKEEESKVLDVDDSAKDAVGEQPPTPCV